MHRKESVLETLSLPPEVLADLSELDAATNERTIAEGGGNNAIGPGELLYGVPEAHIVNAAFPITVRTAADFTVRSPVPGTQAWNLRPQLQKWPFTTDASSKMRD